LNIQLIRYARAMTDDVPWLSRPQLRSWLVISAALTALPNAVEAQLKRDAALNFFEYSVLAALSVSPDRAMKMSQLASFSYGSPSRLSHAMTRMERAGWVQRRAGAGSSRAVEAALTDAGHAKVVEAAPGHVTEVRRLVVDVLSATELDQLEALLRKIMAVAAPATTDLVDQSLDQQHPDDGVQR
jgi:DNA-binding MarR family transcriptional regulator